MLPRIEARYGQKLTVVCNERATSIYEDHPSVEQIVPVDRKRILEDADYVNSLLARLSEIKADVVLNSVYSRDIVSDLLSAACKAPVKIGFRGDLCNQTSESREKHASIYSHLIDSEEEHLSEFFRHQEFISAIGGDSAPLTIALPLTRSELGFADTFYRERGLDPEKTIIFGAFSNEPIKNYPFWVEVLTELSDKLEFSLLALGASVDRKATQDILDQVAIPSVNVCGDTNLKESAALISKSRFVLAVDTSIPHIAVAVGTPNLVLLGGGHFGRFFPYSSLTSVICLPLSCYGCRWRCPHSVSHCITDILPQAVASATLHNLHDKQTKPRLYIQEKNLESQEDPEWHQTDRWINGREVERISITDIISGSKMMTNSTGTVRPVDRSSLRLFL